MLTMNISIMQTKLKAWLYFIMVDRNKSKANDCATDGAAKYWNTTNHVWIESAVWTAKKMK